MQFLYPFCFYINKEKIEEYMKKSLIYNEKFASPKIATHVYEETVNNFFIMEQEVKKRKKVYYSLKQLLNECPFYGIESFGENFIC